MSEAGLGEVLTSFSSCSAALMPSQVEAILIKMRSLPMPWRHAKV